MQLPSLHGRVVDVSLVPWSLAAARALSAESTLSDDQRGKARVVADRLESRFSEAKSLIGTGFYYQTSEFIIGESINQTLSARQ